MRKTLSFFHIVCYASRHHHGLFFSSKTSRMFSPHIYNRRCSFPLKGMSFSDWHGIFYPTPCCSICSTLMLFCPFLKGHEMSALYSEILQNLTLSSNKTHRYCSQDHSQKNNLDTSIILSSQRGVSSLEPILQNQRE